MVARFKGIEVLFQDSSRFFTLLPWAVERIILLRSGDNKHAACTYNGHDKKRSDSEGRKNNWKKKEKKKGKKAVMTES